MSEQAIQRIQGFGLGLRPKHYNDFLTREIAVDFVEIISENFMVAGGRPLHVLDAVRERHPVAMHGVSMSIGSAGGLNPDYLKRLKSLVARVKPLWVSDHLCWTGVDGFNSHDLLPIPYTEEALEIVCRNVAFAQDFLEGPLLIENPSSYVRFKDETMPEWNFLKELCARTGCYLLLDLNNIHVSGANHGFDPHAFLAGIPLDRVLQIHLAGPSEGDGILIDTHDHDVPAPVWTLFEAISQRVGLVATMIERDDNIPSVDELLSELSIARMLSEKAARIRAA